MLQLVRDVLEGIADRIGDTHLLKPFGGARMTDGERFWRSGCGTAASGRGVMSLDQEPWWWSLFVRRQTSSWIELPCATVCSTWAVRASRLVHETARK